MPNRVLRDGWKDSDSIVGLSWREQVCFLRLLSTVDDFGRYDGRVGVLRTACYPLELDKMSEADLESCLQKLEAAGLVSFYYVQDKRYVELLNFRQQVRAKTSKWPDPPSTCPAGAQHMHSTCTAHAQHMHTKTETESESKTKANNKTTHTQPRERAGGVQPLPRSVEEVLGYMHNMPHCGLQGPEAEACARKFFDSGEECGWLTKNGLPVNDWHASLRKYVQSWQLHDRYQPSANSSHKPNNYNLRIDP